MKISYQGLLRFLNDKPDISEISEKLFQLGHEHEIENQVFDFEFTPNRGDCLSLLGIARDLNVFFETKKEVELYDRPIKDLELNFTNHSPEACPFVSFLKINITGDVSPYKKYLSDYFEKTGAKKKNLFTDISNFISYELGQPTHCFDFEKINGDLVFEYAECSGTFNTLFGNEIKLENKNCVFKIGDEIISLAGVMGGNLTACSNETKTVLIECAYFNPESIIGKAIKYNINSDSAHKFERGTDPQAIDKTLRRFIKIVEDHVKIESIGLYSFRNTEYDQKVLKIDVDYINKVLGTSISKKEYTSILQKLGFKVKKELFVPSFRHDINSQNDLAEEVARVIGYNNITSSPLVPKIIETKYSDKKSKVIKSFLLSVGFNEVINMPFDKNCNDSSIKVDNPLDSNKKYLRTDLKQSLVKNLLFNERRQKDSIKLFESSDVYRNANEIKKSSKIGIIVSGRMGHDYINFTKMMNDNYLNKILSSILNNKLDIQKISRKDLNSKIKNEIFYVELDIEKVSLNVGLKEPQKLFNKNFIKYEQISEYPSSARDFSFLIKEISNYEIFLSALNGIKNEILKDLFIFDFYKNEDLQELKIGVRMIFQSKTKTLLEGDIQQCLKEILYPILKIDGVSIPGINFE